MGARKAHRLGSSGSSMKVRLGADPLFIDDAPRREAIEAIGGGDRMRLALCDEMREAPSGRRRRLEAAVAPASVQIESANRRAVDDRRSVHRHVHETAPVTQHTDAAE